MTNLSTFYCEVVRTLFGKNILTLSPILEGSEVLSDKSSPVIRYNLQCQSSV